MIVGIITICIVAIVMIAIGVIILLGKGSNLIAGYNTASEQDKAMYDEKKLNRLMGTTCIIIGLITLPLAYNPAFGILYTFLIIVLCVIAIIMANTWAKKK